MKKHPGYALALTASSLILLDAALLAGTFAAVLVQTSFYEPHLSEMLSTTPLPFALYLTWGLAVCGSAAAIVAILLYGFRERWFWRCMMLGAILWLFFPPVHMVIGLVSLILLIHFRGAFPKHLSPTAATTP